MSSPEACQRQLKISVDVEHASSSLEHAFLGGRSSVDGCISELPDDILCNILSFLDLKEAFRTRLLTRSWRHLCIPIRHLQLDSSMIFNFDYTHSFFSPSRLSASELRGLRCKFVEKVDQLLNQLVIPQKLLSFRVAFNLNIEFSSHLEEWIKFALRMESEKIDISILSCRKYPDKEALYFPCHVLPLGEGSSLKHLSLRGCLLSPPPELANRLNCLQSLTLTDVFFRARDIEAVLSGCLNLERLELLACDFRDTLRICGGVPRLKWLILGGTMIDIVLSSINLKSFKYCGDLINFSFSNVVELSDITLKSASTYVTKECKDDLFRRLGRDVPNLQEMTLYVDLDQVHPIPAKVTQFGRLKLLTMVVAVSTASDLLEITHVVNACPQLEKLRLCVQFTYVVKGERRSRNYAGQLHMGLRHIALGGVCKNTNSLELAKYFLRNAVALEEMKILTDDRMLGATPDQVYNLLLKEKANPHARLFVK